MSTRLRFTGARLSGGQLSLFARREREAETLGPVDVWLRAHPFPPQPTPPPPPRSFSPPPAPPPPPPRGVQPESMAAHAAICEAGRRTMNTKVYRWIEEHGPAGATADEICAEKDLSINSIAPRINELLHTGDLVLTGKHRRTRAGHPARVVASGRWS